VTHSRTPPPRRRSPSTPSRRSTTRSSKPVADPGCREAAVTRSRNIDVYRLLLAALAVASLATLALRETPAPGTLGAFAAGEGNAANVFATTTLEPPEDLVATPFDATTVDLTWTATVSPFAEGYEVYRSQTGGGPYAFVDGVDRK